MTLPEHLEYVANVPEQRGGMVQPKQAPNRCPECGQDMTDSDPAKHALQHWPARWDPNNPPSAEAVKRRDTLLRMDVQRRTEDNWP